MERLFHDISRTLSKEDLTRLEELERTSTEESVTPPEYGELVERVGGRIARTLSSSSVDVRRERTLPRLSLSSSADDATRRVRRTHSSPFKQK